MAQGVHERPRRDLGSDPRPHVQTINQIPHLVDTHAAAANIHEQGRRRAVEIMLGKALCPLALVVREDLIEQGIDGDGPRLSAFPTHLETTGAGFAAQ